ncbi:hypothetical protein C8Q76DRAFT_702053 [Earliella scabrosa]|nr:hypothetical protein C8Q76DRAFT_702053 [Earliella scabrosa]
MSAPPSPGGPWLTREGCAPCSCPTACGPKPASARGSSQRLASPEASLTGTLSIGRGLPCLTLPFAFSITVPTSPPLRCSVLVPARVLAGGSRRPGGEVSGSRLAPEWSSARAKHGGAQPRLTPQPRFGGDMPRIRTPGGFPGKRASRGIKGAPGEGQEGKLGLSSIPPSVRSLIRCPGSSFPLAIHCSLLTVHL